MKRKIISILLGSTGVVGLPLMATVASCSCSNKVEYKMGITHTWQTSAIRFKQESSPDALFTTGVIKATITPMHAFIASDLVWTASLGSTNIDPDRIIPNGLDGIQIRINENIGEGDYKLNVNVKSRSLRIVASESYDVQVVGKARITAIGNPYPTFGEGWETSFQYSNITTDTHSAVGGVKYSLVGGADGLPSGIALSEAGVLSMTGKEPILEGKDYHAVIRAASDGRECDDYPIIINLTKAIQINDLSWQGAEKDTMLCGVNAASQSKLSGDINTNTLYIGKYTQGIKNWAFYDNAFPGSQIPTTIQHIIFANDNTIKTIPDSAFYELNDVVQDITFGPALTSVGDGCFVSKCGYVTDISFKSTTPPSISNTAFAGVAGHGKIYVPHGATTAYQLALAANKLRSWEIIEYLV